MNERKRIVNGTNSMRSGLKEHSYANVDDVLLCDMWNEFIRRGGRKAHSLYGWRIHEMVRDRMEKRARDSARMNEGGRINQSLALYKSIASNFEISFFIDQEVSLEIHMYMIAIDTVSLVRNEIAGAWKERT